jgi:Winged helix DNA-binding domain
VPAERVLTTRELNRALLARQFLLERSSLPLVQTIERIGGLQTQYAPSGYVGLWSRQRGLRRQALTSALEQRRVVQGTLLRSTIHMVSPRDYWLFLAGIRHGRREWFRRITRKEFLGLDMETAARVLESELAKGPQRAEKLRKILEERGIPRVAWAGVDAWIDMVRVPPSGTWEQRRANLYGLAATWLRPVSHSEEAGIEHLIRRYLGGFGPAAANDIADWAGIAPARLRAFIERLALRRLRDERGRQLFDLPRAPLPQPSTAAPVRFLPTWDATLLVHARRTQILPEQYRPLIFHTKMPQSKPTFLIDGAVAGTWRYASDRILIEPFEPMPRRVKQELDAEADRLAEFHRVSGI